MVRSLRLTGALSAVAFAVTVATAGPAAAHAEVEAEGARALDQNVELTFSAESESAAAGISKLEVVLPKGLVPQDITYEEGPKGWKFAPTGRGYTVSGPKLAVGEDAEYVVTVRQLPDAKELVFKTLQTYSDGKVDRWIGLEEEAEGGGHGHGHPAPRLELKAAAPGAKSVSPTPTKAPTTSASSSATAPQEPTAGESSADPVADETKDDDAMPMAVPLGIGAVVLVLGGGVWWFRNRRSGSA
ncbi:membrane protein [Streptomyces sp. NRRL B-1140]|nr:membrane protein [Streptomyces sp. NRRL B-1140]